MKKQTKVLAAATLLTLGASFSALAATGIKNGTWVNGDEGWQYVDKEGEYVESEWCQSNGIDFWINDEGFLGANEWVTEGDWSYYVQSDGSMAMNTWKYIYGEDDEDADEESWFYFDSKGRMVENDDKKIDGKTYYFDDKGKMLTGWVDTANFINAEEDSKGTTDIANVVFCDENGARVNNSWIHEFPWDADLDLCYEDEHEEWFYAGSEGKLTKNKKTIEGLTYIFNSKTREMLEGWVVYDGTYYFESAEETAFDAQDAVDVYYATEDAGYIKKNGWRELEDPTEDDDYWYYFDKLGRAVLGKATESNAQVMTFDDGEAIYSAVIPDSDGFSGNVESRKIGGVKYYFNINGEMLNGLVTIDDKLMYLDGGAAQTGKVTLTDENENDYTFCFADKTEDDYVKYVAVNGNKDGYCYSNGLIVKADESGVYKIVEIGENKFLVDYRGKIMHNSSKEYECEDGSTYTFTFNEKTDGLGEDSIATQTLVVAE